ncbi:MAG: DUF2933 domain-containing protein [Pseudomonas sp.]
MMVFRSRRPAAVLLQQTEVIVLHAAAYSPEPYLSRRLRLSLRNANVLRCLACEVRQAVGQISSFKVGRNMSNGHGSFWWSPKGLAALGLIGAASYFLLMEHRQHVFVFLPFLIILLCPLMHIFMHGGHGGHGEKGQGGADTSKAMSGASDAERAAYQRGLEVGKRQSDHHQH